MEHITYDDFEKADIRAGKITRVEDFPPKQVADIIPEVLVLGVVLDNNDVVLVQPDREVMPGSRIL